MWYHEADAMTSGLMAGSLVALVMEVEVIRLESSSTREVWSDVGLSSSFSVLSLPAWCLYALCPPPERWISSALLTAYLRCDFISHPLFVCSRLSSPLQPFVSILSFGNFFLVGCFLCAAICVLVSPVGGHVAQARYVKCLCIVYGYAITMAQNICCYWLHFLVSLHWVQGKLMLVIP